MNKLRILIGTFTLGLGLPLALLWLVGDGLAARATAPSGPGDIYCVTSGGGPYPACDQVFATIQGAVNAVVGGETIYIATGAYTGSGGAVITITKSITLYGGWDGTATTPLVHDPDTHVTKLDGQGQRRVVYISGSANATLDGLHLFSGTANDDGGGVYAETGSNVLLSSCQIYSNTAQSHGVGGGLYIRGNITMTDNKVYSNTVQGTHGNGAGVALVNSNNATLIGNQIYGNRSLSTAGMGGGVVIYRSNATLTDNDIYNNTTSGSGGGVNINETSGNSVTLSGNRIYGNGAASGGGVIVGDCAVTMTENLVYGNTAVQGGGLWFNISYATLVNNIVVGNQTTGGGGGIAARVFGSDVRMLHTTIARNSGGSGSGILVTDFGVGNNSTVALTNTILVSHSVGIQVTDGQTVTVNSVLWHHTPITISKSPAATVTVQNQVTGDPAFVNPDSDNYHITPGSAAVDKGVPAGVETDIDGQERPRNGVYDIGADELNYFVYLPLVLRDFP